MKTVISAVEAEYRRYRTLAEEAMAQLSDAQLHERFGDGNSVATLMQHLGGNLNSRFTDFLASDGEKEWRDREGEFADRALGRAELATLWGEGWATLFEALGTLSDGQLEAKVLIRGVPLSVMEALARSLSHAAYHVGQIVLVARGLRGADWKFLSIPPGGSAAYNAAPSKEKPPG